MPISSRLVAAQSIWNRFSRPRFFTMSRMAYIDMGERQIEPWQMNKIFIMLVFTSLCRVLPYFMRVSAIFDFIEIRHKLASPCISWTSMLIKC